MGFYGKAEKPSFHHSFRSVERRTQFVSEWFASIEQTDARKAERKANRKAFRHTLKVGDVLRSSWGYDQTNIDYYEVTALVGEHMIEAREIGAESSETGFMQGKCVPTPGNYTGPAKRYRPTEGNAVKVRSFAWARPVAYREVAGARVYSTDHWTAYA
jgi:hypothetical protein